MNKMLSICIICLLSIAHVASADIEQGLVAYYPFNGNANDESGSGNNGSVHGATLSADRSGNPNAAFSFDGNDYIEIPDSNSLDITDAITISAWVKVRDFYNGAIISKGTNDSNDSYFLTANTPIRWHLNTTHGQFWFDGTQKLEFNRWYHVAATFDGSRARIFVNGTDNGYIWRSGKIVPNDFSLTIGKRGGDTHWWNGSIDEVRIYNRALHVTEIAELYTGVAVDKYLDFWYVQRRSYEEGNEFNRVSFAFRDQDDNYILEDVLSTVEIFDPEGIEVQPTNNMFSGAYQVANGVYNSDDGRWQFDDSLHNESGYMINFVAPLKPGFYHLIVTDTAGKQFQAYKAFNGTQTIPMILSDSICAFKSQDGKLTWNWEVPSQKYISASTSVRTYATAYNSDENYIGEVYIRVPTHMGWAFAPAALLEQLEQAGAKSFKIGVQVRTNDNNNREYSAEVSWEEANACNCDINGDLKTGLQEAIHAMKVAADLK